MFLPWIIFILFMLLTYSAILFIKKKRPPKQFALAIILIYVSPAVMHRMDLISMVDHLVFAILASVGVFLIAGGSYIDK